MKVGLRFWGKLVWQMGNHRMSRQMGNQCNGNHRMRWQVGLGNQCKRGQREAAWEADQAAVDHS